MTKIICFLFFINSFSLVAQDFVIKEVIENHKRGIPNREAANAYFDENSNKLILTYLNKSSMYVNTYINSKIDERYEFIRDEDPGLFNQISAAIMKDQKNFYLFFANPTCVDFSVIFLNLKDKAIQRYPELIHLDKDELYQYSFTSQNQFYILTAVKNTNKLRIYKFSFENFMFNKLEIDIEELMVKDVNGISYSVLWWAISENKRFMPTNNLFKYFKLVNSASDINPSSLAKPLKYYSKNGHIIITIDGHRKSTKMIDIDLKVGNYNYTEFEFPAIGAYANDVKKNSYVFENFLLQVKVSRDSLLICALEMQTKQRILKYSCSATDEKCEFINSPIRKITKSVDFGFENVSYVKNFKRALREFSENNIYIGAIQNPKGEVEITLGSYYKVTVSSSTPMASVNNTTEYIYSFKSIWSPDFQIHLKGSVGESYYDKLLARIRELNGPSKSQVIYSLPDQSYYFGYFKGYDDGEEKEFDNSGGGMYFCVERFGPIR